MGHRLLFVMAWFGESVRGGAEKFCFELCTELAKRGFEIEVWATATSSLAAWNDSLLNDQGQNLNIKIRRFKTQKWTEKLFHRIHAQKNQRQIPWWLDILWVYSNLYGYGMRRALRRNAPQFNSIHLAHYMSGTSHRLYGIATDKVILHPFLHDELPAYSPIMKRYFANARAVFCNTDSEIDVAFAKKNLCSMKRSEFKVIGNGVESSTSLSSSSLPRNLPDRFIVYVGRIIPEKNIPLLIDWHQSLSFPLGLVLIGEGGSSAPQGHPDRPILHFGWMSQADKRCIVSNALALVQLSVLESFSLVIMESWLENVPVIVHSGCPATSKHIANSNGGFAVSSQKEFESALCRLNKEPVLRLEMAKQGRRYVQSQFSWEKVCENFTQSLNEVGLLRV